MDDNAVSKVEIGDISKDWEIRTKEILIRLQREPIMSAAACQVLLNKEM